MYSEVIASWPICAITVSNSRRNLCSTVCYFFYTQSDILNMFSESVGPPSLGSQSLSSDYISRLTAMHMKVCEGIRPVSSSNSNIPSNSVLGCNSILHILNFADEGT